MRTTVVISDSLMAKVRATMSKRRVTLRALVEEGLRLVVETGEREPIADLPDARFRGRLGLVDGLDPQDLPRRIAESIAEGRGTAPRSRP